MSPKGDNLKMGQAHSDWLAEPATVYRGERELFPWCWDSHPMCSYCSTMAGASLQEEVCSQFWSLLPTGVFDSVQHLLST